VGGFDLDIPLVGWVLGEGKAGCSTCVIIKLHDDGGRTWTWSPTPEVNIAIGREHIYCQNSGGCVTHLVFVNREDGYLSARPVQTTMAAGEPGSPAGKSRPPLWRQSRQGWSSDSPTMKMAVRDHVV